MKTIPYTYLIGWSKQKVYYYGVRYANGCSPPDLWNPYKTSSKHVRAYVESHGDPDIFDVRRVFNSISAARAWEHTVLRRMNVIKREDFLNKTTNVSIAPGLNKGYRHTEKTKVLMSVGQKLRGGNGPKKHSEETKQKMSLKRQGRQPALGSKWTEEQKLAQSIRCKKNWNNQYKKKDKVEYV
jgi:hypothetical protein